jgi:ADP-ribose pyrophosphatase
MSDARLRERTLGSRVIHRGRFITFRIDTIEDASGGVRTREVVAHPGAVAIVPLDGDDLLMVRQHRTAVGRALLEIPAGTLDHAADGRLEAPDSAAARELAEETGFRAATWRGLGRFYSAPGFTDELMHLFLAYDLAPIEDYDGPDVDEHLVVERVPWRDALAMLERGEIEDAKTVVGLLWLARLAAQDDPALKGR